MKPSSGNKASKGNTNSPRSGGQELLKKDRKSSSGMMGSPKKGGKGGKFTWAGDGYSGVELGFDKEGHLDVKDPNYEDAEKITN